MSAEALPVLLMPLSDYQSHRAVVVIAAQMIGGIAAALVVKYMIPGASKVEYTVSLGDKTSVGSGMFLELFFTFELIFTILMLAVEVSPLLTISSYRSTSPNTASRNLRPPSSPPWASGSPYSSPTSAASSSPEPASTPPAPLPRLSYLQIHFHPTTGSIGSALSRAACLP